MLFFIDFDEKRNAFFPNSLSDRGSDRENRIEACYFKMGRRLEKGFREAKKHSRCRFFIKSASRVALRGSWFALVSPNLYRRPRTKPPGQCMGHFAPRVAPKKG